MKKRTLLFPLIIILGVIGLFIFNQSNKTTSNAQSNKRVKIVFWHEMAGKAKDQLTQFVNDFNSSQSKYEIVPQYEGSYNEAIPKILHTHGSSASPALFQSMDASTSTIANSNITTPVQKFANQDHYDLNQISPVARAFYSKNNQLNSMPFNTSQPVLYYNASLLKELKITPPPVDPSYSDITRIAKEITERSKGQTKGLSIEAYGWFFEQFMANNNQMFTNQENGHQGIPTKVSFNNPSEVEAMKFIQQNIKNNSFMNFGGGGNAVSNEMASFLSRKIGIFLQSSASTSQILAGTKDQLGITNYPHADNQKPNGVSIGGASLWINNDKSDDTQRGAWEFMKYLMEPKNQAQWQVSTGYLALNQKSNQEPVLKDLYKKYPETKVPGNQLNRTKPNAANSGILLDSLPASRTMTPNTMSYIFNGGDINKALKDSENSMNELIAQHNKANGY